jgi:hypothetical protein
MKFMLAALFGEALFLALFFSAIAHKHRDTGLLAVIFFAIAGVIWGVLL